MNVHLRQRKQTKAGSISLYLEIYKGTAKQPDGTLKVLRDYEYLDLFLMDKPVTPLDKQSNKDTLALAKTIKAKRELEIKNGQYGFSSNKNKNANFINYFDDQAENRLQSKGNYDNWNSTLKHLKKFAGDQVTFNEVTPEFCEQFRNYLRDKAKTKSEKNLSSASVSSYFNKFRACLSQARKDKIILSNPADDITNSLEIESEREYLTFDEVKKLAKAECRYDVLKRAFLFSCLTGLRWSDIQKMKWSEVKKTDDGDRCLFQSKSIPVFHFKSIPF